MFYNVTPTPHPNLQVKSMLPVILWPPVCWAYHHTVLCLAFVLVFPTVNEETSCSSERPSRSELPESSGAAEGIRDRGMPWSQKRFKRHEQALKLEAGRDYSCIFHESNHVFPFAFFFFLPLPAFKNDFPLFFSFLHFLFHHKMISLINLFNKHARGAFRLTGSALGSKGKAVDTVLSGTHENTGCEIWGMAAGTGNHRVIGGHLQST